MAQLVENLPALQDRMCAKSFQLRLTLCDPMDGSPSGSSVHGILQSRILEWVAVPSSRGSSWPRDWTCVSYVSWVGRQVLYNWHHQYRGPSFSPWIGEIPYRKEWLPTPLFLPGESHGQILLCPWDCKEADTTERPIHTQAVNCFVISKQ